MEDEKEKPEEKTLSADLAMDAVTLRVGNLELMSDYYAKSLGLYPIEELSVKGETKRVLGRGADPVVRLVHTPGLPEVNPREAGLYHTAFLFRDKAALAAAVYSTATTERNRFQGSSDHLVSEAFYFMDPEGNGIELYVDRPREEWQYRGKEVRMDTVFLDPNAYLRDNLSEERLKNLGDDPVGVGHVHLQVGDIAPARSFYIDALGFEPTFDSYPGALFASAGGYHHHVAMNTWNSRGAGPRAAGLGLADLAISLPGRDHLDALAARLKERGIEYADTGNSIVTSDPWGTQVTVSLPDSSAEEVLAR